MRPHERRIDRNSSSAGDARQAWVRERRGGLFERLLELDVELVPQPLGVPEDAQDARGSTWSAPAPPGGSCRRRR